MNETTILLSSGDPKAKPDFLATLEPALPRHPPFNLPFELVIDEYTREPWSSGKRDVNMTGGGKDEDDDDEWISCYLVSTDGRNRLTGFLKYLRERKKAAVARFEPSDAPGRAVLVVPHDQPPVPANDMPEGVDGSRVVFVKYLRNESILRKGDRPPHDAGKARPHRDDARAREERQISTPTAEKQQQQQLPRQNQNQTRHGSDSQRQSTTREKIPIPARPAASSSGKRGGLLGNLLGAQRRTENHLDLVRTKKATNELSFDPTAGASGCINSFRAKVSSDLESFKSDPTSFVTKIPIALASIVRSVPPDERDRVTMDVFRFAIYEQVEEVGMDRWVAVKEPSEFMDECVITVYKEGHCPMEVLEEMNKGELPDEIRGQARHIVESQSKAVQRKEKRMDEIIAKKNSKVDDVVVLNTNKRDRRTLEQIQKDLLDEDEDVKRNRFR
jgi:hypothetical protein